MKNEPGQHNFSLKVIQVLRNEIRNIESLKRHLVMMREVFFINPKCHFVGSQSSRSPAYHQTSSKLC